MLNILTDIIVFLIVAWTIIKWPLTIVVGWMIFKTLGKTLDDLDDKFTTLEDIDDKL